MRVNQNERLRRHRDFEFDHRRLRVNQIETMIGEFDRMCADLGQQIEAEEVRAGVSDLKNFAYPMYARAARERHTKLQRSTEALRNELATLRVKEDDHPVAA